MLTYKGLVCALTIAVQCAMISLPAAAAAEGGSTPQSEKLSFLDNDKNPPATTYSVAVVTKPMSPYQLMAGTVIPSVLISGVNSDLPGQIIAQVSQNVYNSVTGEYVVIPQGTKLIGQYDSNVSYGQKRVLVVWTRMIFPNGSSISLDRLQGVDLAGYAGFHDKVDNHNGKVYGSVILGSILSAAAAVATAHDADDNSFRAAAGSGAAENIANTVSNKLQKDLSIQPTLTIRPGYKFNVFLTKDIVFTEAYPH